MKTLPDLLDKNLAVLSVGLNPSLPSVDAGFYFANPRNRFWKALNACNAFDEQLEASLESCHRLHQQYRIGFTDLVKRPTAGCKDLNANDYRAGSQRLQDLINKLNPRVIWFHGKLTCQKYVQYSDDKSRAIDWGLQHWEINKHSVFVTPNPSPANAVFSLSDISESYQQLFQHASQLSTC
ncbi:MAG TPA: mismatch-specific DNA-glycosylase [Cycloclasticus sp.]|jgi:TDG/mug DNA glycosylase family protein|nr:mismatch-specific DNA-glycosylase [Cycloclasticus sp.]